MCHLFKCIVFQVISLVEDESSSESECCCFIRTIFCVSSQNDECCSEDETFVERGDRTPEQVSIIVLFKKQLK